VLATTPEGVPITALPEGWDAAVQYHRLRRVLPIRLRREVEDRAVRIILDRARAMLRHTTRPTNRVADRFPADGDLHLERTLAHRFAGRRHEIVVERVQPRSADVVAVLDMSLSMTGEKIALTALATAILALSVGRIGVISFDTIARRLVHLGDRVGPEELVRRVLTVPAQGYTNISAGLRMTGSDLLKSSRRERSAVLMTDGMANVGGNPVSIAARIPKLHVVQVGADEPRGARACRAMATAGRGRHYSAPGYQDLPGIVRQLVRECFRG
jgi:Mg-chelatase subunit ChlD